MVDDAEGRIEKTKEPRKGFCTQFGSYGTSASDTNMDIGVDWVLTNTVAVDVANARFSSSMSPRAGRVGTCPIAKAKTYQDYGAAYASSCPVSLPAVMSWTSSSAQHCPAFPVDRWAGFVQRSQSPGKYDVEGTGLRQQSSRARPIAAITPISDLVLPFEATCVCDSRHSSPCSGHIVAVAAPRASATQHGPVGGTYATQGVSSVVGIRQQIPSLGHETSRYPPNGATRRDTYGVWDSFHEREDTHSIATSYLQAFPATSLRSIALPSRPPPGRKRAAQTQTLQNNRQPRPQTRLQFIINIPAAASCCLLSSSLFIDYLLEPLTRPALPERLNPTDIKERVRFGSGPSLAWFFKRRESSRTWLPFVVFPCSNLLWRVSGLSQLHCHPDTVELASTLASRSPSLKSTLSCVAVFHLRLHSQHPFRPPAAASFRQQPSFLLFLHQLHFASIAPRRL
ncbi:hypothetical protein SODALDRAFT_362352 [Sodiomyces alkalinus F11]|uniref:Uncharacterized protein n=1 Tax=Sodiomyces alkalinus (strain CBS 110278 / VKM F-3762 / F11) TaxID=1314773 RepID=A0A3N2PQ34_SODAK|nr:hypothetical protein SODALDRAFT_362352 [Sodiomyces alkalinus F11]ROT36540.1 hypothetical protein SODALDRAFT_362352 [Sodiomyces alkalinus F11]